MEPHVSHRRRLGVQGSRSTLPGWILAAALLLVPTGARGADIAIIKSSNLAPFNDAIVGFQTNCPGSIAEYDMEGNLERGHEITKKILENKPQVVLAVGVQAAAVARDDLKSIPVVFAVVANPESSGLVGVSNLTGVSLVIPVRTQLLTLKSIVPKVTRVGVIYNPRKTGAIIEEAFKAAKELGFVLIASKVDAKEDVPKALRAFSEGVDAFWMVPDPTVVSPESFRLILDFTFEKKVPFLAYAKPLVDQGALVSLAPSYSGMGAQACSIAKQVLGGASISKIPVAAPKGLELTFNLNTAKRIGVDNIAATAVGFAASEGYKISVSQ